MGGHVNLDGGMLTLDRETLTLDGETRPPYNLSTASNLTFEPDFDSR